MGGPITNSIPRCTALKSIMKYLPMNTWWKEYYGWVGVLVVVFMELSALLDIPHINIWVTPVAWYGYILLFDWLVYKKSAQSLLMTNFKEFLIMLPSSVALWCVFELHNLCFLNWEYVQLPDSNILTAIGFVTSFATILPALYVTYLYLREISFLQIKVTPHMYSKRRLLLEIIFGIALIIVATAYPSRYTGPLIWPCYLFVFVPLNYLLGVPSVLKEREAGNYRDMLAMFCSGYICGFFWEFFNFWAGSKWVYHVPFLHDIKIFEMPIVGFLGFGPFAIAFIEMYRFLMYFPHWLTVHTRKKI